MSRNEAGQVEYRALINTLNWRQRAVPIPTSSDATRAALNAMRTCNGESTWQLSDANTQLVQAVRADVLIQDVTAGK